MAEKRIIPNLFIVGAPKCGTTAMHTYLGQHPAIFMAADKENNHFAADLLPPNDPFRSDERYFAMFARAGDKVIVGESSVYYLLSQEAAVNIHRFNSQAKIIIMLRNPVDVLPSFHAQLVLNRDEEIGDLEKALAAEAGRKSGAVKIKAGLRFKERLFYGEVVAFSEQVRRYLAIFPREQVEIIVYDDFKQDPAGVYRRTLEFLGVDPAFVPAFPIINSRRQARLPGPVGSLLAKVLGRERQRVKAPGQYLPLEKSFRQRLQLRYRQEIERLGRLIGRDLTAWAA